MVFALVLALLGLPALGAEPALPRPIRSDRFRLYQPLEGRDARALLERAQAFGRRSLGDPALPVRQVHLRRSVPLADSPDLPRDFQLTEIADSSGGVFTIYLSALPSQPAFAGQLAHEALHLRNARLRDAYVEGLCCLLAEEFLKEEGLPWEPWERHFAAGKDPLYAAAYYLACELAQEIGREPLLRILKFAVERDSDFPWMEVDIDRWLDSLDPPSRARARAVIARRYQVLDLLRRKEQPGLTFRLPRGLALAPPPPELVPSFTPPAPSPPPVIR